MTRLKISPQFDNFLGTSWVPLGDEYVELAPVDDAPPFPPRLISVAPVPRAVEPKEALDMLVEAYSALHWDGSFHASLAGSDDRCALVLVDGNCMVGQLLVIARPFDEGGEFAVLFYEAGTPEHVAQFDVALRAVDALRWPFTVDERREADADHGNSTATAARMQSSLAWVSKIQPELSVFVDRALAEQDLLRRSLGLLDLFARALQLPRFVGELDAASGKTMLRILRGVCITLLRHPNHGFLTYAASVLARALVSHPVSDLKRLFQAQMLSAHLIARTHDRDWGRWEEAMVSNLLALAAIVVHVGREDYGRLNALASLLQQHEHGAVRVLRHVVEAWPLLGISKQSNNADELRLTCCDLVLSILQQMHYDVPESRLSSEMNTELDIADWMQFRTSQSEPSGAGDKAASFSGVYESSIRGGATAFAKIYGVDVRAIGEQARADVERMLPENERPRLLYLRGFRSMRRVWLDNTFSFRSRWIVRYVEEPIKLSLEAALNKGLFPYVGVALGGLPDPLGMDKRGAPLSRDWWKVVFSRFLDGSSLVVVVPDDTESLSWELVQLSKSETLGRVLLVMLPRAVDEHAESGWEQLCNIFWAQGLPMPAYEAVGGFVRLDATGQECERWEFDALMDGRLVDSLMDEWMAAK